MYNTAPLSRTGRANHQGGKLKTNYATTKSDDWGVVLSQATPFAERGRVWSRCNH